MSPWLNAQAFSSYTPARVCPQVYGGYLATMLLSSEDFTQLKCGAAVSPITDFELYGLSEPLPCLSVHLSVCTVTLLSHHTVCLYNCLSVPLLSVLSHCLSVHLSVYTITLCPITLSVRLSVPLTSLPSLIFV